MIESEVAFLGAIKEMRNGLRSGSMKTVEVISGTRTDQRGVTREAIRAWNVMLGTDR